MNVLDIIFVDWWHSNIIKTRIDNHKNSFLQQIIRKDQKLQIESTDWSRPVCDDVVSCDSSMNNNYEWQNMEIIIIAILGIDVNLSLKFSKLIQVLYKWEMSQMQNW